MKKKNNKKRLGIIGIFIVVLLMVGFMINTNTNTFTEVRKLTTNKYEVGTVMDDNLSSEVTDPSTQIYVFVSGKPTGASLCVFYITDITNSGETESFGASSDSYLFTELTPNTTYSIYVKFTNLGNQDLGQTEEIEVTTANAEGQSIPNLINSDTGEALSKVYVNNIYSNSIKIKLDGVEYTNENYQYKIGESGEWQDIGSMGDRYSGGYFCGFLYETNDSEIHSIYIKDKTTGQESSPYQIRTCEVEMKGTPYSTIEEAIETAEKGDTIKLMKDITREETIEIQQDITLDLNGKTITSAEDTDALTVEYAQLIIDDSSAEKLGTIKAGNGILAGPDGDIILNNGTIMGTNEVSIDHGIGIVLDGGKPDGASSAIINRRSSYRK